jgi:hypothetical protein
MSTQQAPLISFFLLRFAAHITISLPFRYITTAAKVQNGACRNERKVVISILFLIYSLPILLMVLAASYDYILLLRKTLHQHDFICKVRRWRALLILF